MKITVLYNLKISISLLIFHQHLIIILHCRFVARLDDRIGHEFEVLQPVSFLLLVPENLLDFILLSLIPKTDLDGLRRVLIFVHIIDNVVFAFSDFLLKFFPGFPHPFHRIGPLIIFPSRVGHLPFLLFLWFDPLWFGPGFRNS